MKHENTAKRLKDALYNAGITQRELADKSGVKEASISQYINGSHKPSNISAGKMATVLGVNPVWLVGYDVPMLIDNDSFDTGTVLGKAARDPNQIRLLSNYQKLDDDKQGQLLQFSEALTLLP